MGFFSDLGLKLDNLFSSSEDIQISEEEIKKADERYREECERKGNYFEEYVIDLVLSNNKNGKEYFELEYRTHDYIRHDKKYRVKSDTYPDLVFIYLPTNERFAVECKYRSSYVKSKRHNTECVLWSNYEQINRYRDFEMEKNIPVFVAIGLGSGKGSSLKDGFSSMICMPLSEAKYPELFPSVLKKYVRPVDKNLFWNPKEKTLK